MNIPNSVVYSLAGIAKTMPSTAGARIIAAVVQRGKIVGLGINSYKTHPLQAKFADNPYKMHLHAETSAIVDAMRRCGEDAKAGVLRHRSLAVVRVKRTPAGVWMFGLARPCQACERLIEWSGLDQVLWSTDSMGCVDRV